MHKINIFVGRMFSVKNEFYGSVQVDELYYFNRSLTGLEIKILSETTAWVTCWGCLKKNLLYFGVEKHLQL